MLRTSFSFDKRFTIPMIELKKPEQSSSLIMSFMASVVFLSSISENVHSLCAIILKLLKKSLDRPEAISSDKVKDSMMNKLLSSMNTVKLPFKRVGISKIIRNIEIPNKYILYPSKIFKTSFIEMNQQ